MNRSSECSKLAQEVDECLSCAIGINVPQRTFQSTDGLGTSVITKIKKCLGQSDLNTAGFSKPLTHYYVLLLRRWQPPDFVIKTPFKKEKPVRLICQDQLSSFMGSNPKDGKCL